MQRASCASISLRAARPACELRVGDAPRPRLRIARQLGHEPDPADDAALEKGDAIGTRLGVREGTPPEPCGELAMNDWPSVPVLKRVRIITVTMRTQDLPEPEV